MKRILALFCLALTIAPLGAEARSLHALTAGVGLGLRVGAVIDVAFDGSDRDRRRRRDDDDGNGQPAQGDRDGRGDGRGNGRNGGEDRNDNRINRAIQIASSRGRYMDAWPEGGSLFWVRVSTDHGRVDLLIDTDTGRIIEER